MKLEELTAYTLSVELSQKIWDIVSRWNYFEKDTVGKQLTRCTDSVGANIAEGYGRYHFAEKIKFYYYARGSVYECQFFIKRSFERHLIDQKQHDDIIEKLRKMPKEINNLIYGCKKQKYK